jgi:hypothetical protein
MPFLAVIEGFANPCLLVCLASRILSYIFHNILHSIHHNIHAHSDTYFELDMAVNWP